VVAATRDEKEFRSEQQYHEREWIVQRLGWAAMAIFIAIALVGGFGAGPLSERRVGDAAVATLHYERFARYSSRSHIELTIASAARSHGTVSFELNESYLRDFELESIVPEPKSVEAHDDRVRFVFDASATPATIALDLLPERIGGKHAVFRVAGRELRFDQFIYP